MHVPGTLYGQFPSWSSVHALSITEFHTQYSRHYFLMAASWISTHPAAGPCLEQGTAHRVTVHKWEQPARVNEETLSFS